MLIRCQQCQALFSLQDGVAGAAGTFKVECGRCHNLFDAAAPHKREPMPPAPSVAKREALERSAVADEPMRALEPLEPGDEELQRPARRRRRKLWRLAAIAVLAIAALALRARLTSASRRSRVRMEQARQKLLRDDAQSLQEATELFTEAARLSPGAAAPEAERAFSLLLQAGSHKALADHGEMRLLQEGLAAARAALDDDSAEAAALRALALHAAVSGDPGTGAQPLERASRLAPGDPWVAYTRAALILAEPPSREAQDRALAALAVARQREPRMLRAQVEVAAIAVDRGEPGPARVALTQVLQENPKHERAQRLLASLPIATSGGK